AGRWGGPAGHSPENVTGAFNTHCAAETAVVCFSKSSHGWVQLREVLSMRRHLRLPVLFAQSLPASSGPLAIASVRAWRLREPDSGRRYTVIQVTSQSGLSGFGEGGPIHPADFAEARKALTDRRVTALEFVRHKFADTPSLEAAIGNALLDLAA